VTELKFFLLSLIALRLVRLVLCMISLIVLIVLCQLSRGEASAVNHSVGAKSD
jgi:hypothetical protein